MDQGNEGDEIILLAFRQIECNIPPNLTSIGQLHPEMIVEIAARSLLLISSGDVKFSTELPSNIASRHRICTNIAFKLKEAGFLGDCGYNQLLYPVEQQTRALLNWLVLKLPRSKEESAEEALGANAVLNKVIIESFLTWRNQAYQLSKESIITLFNTTFSPKASSVDSSFDLGSLPKLGMTRLYSFETLLLKISSIENLSFVGKPKEILIDKLPPTILELNSFFSINDDEFSDQLSSDIKDAHDSFGPRIKNNNRKFTYLSENLKSSVRSTISIDLSDKMFDFDSIKGIYNDQASFANRLKNNSDNLSSSLSDLLDTINQNSIRQSECPVGTRDARFINATKFSHENSQAIDILSIQNQSIKAPISHTDPNQNMNSDTLVANSSIDYPKSNNILSEESLNELRSDIQNDFNHLDNSKKIKLKLNEKFKYFETDLSIITSESEKIENEIILKRKVLEMLPTATENIEKLKKICSSSILRLMELGQEWESHRVILFENIRKPKSNKTQRKLKCKKMVEEMKIFREDMQKMVIDLKNKQEKSYALKEELEKLPRNINRNLYIFRIMDIISQIAKQDKEIQKIVTDIHDSQKAINQGNSSLNRADTLAEEKIFSAANSSGGDTAMTETYRHLKNLRSNFELLISTFEKNALQEKMMKNLESKIDQEKARVSANNFERIQHDLELIKNENKELFIKLKSFTN